MLKALVSLAFYITHKNTIYTISSSIQTNRMENVYTFFLFEN